MAAPLRQMVGSWSRRVLYCCVSHNPEELARCTRPRSPMYSQDAELPCHCCPECRYRCRDLSHPGTPSMEAQDSCPTKNCHRAPALLGTFRGLFVITAAIIRVVLTLGANPSSFEHQSLGRSRNHRWNHYYKPSHPETNVQ